MENCGRKIERVSATTTYENSGFHRFVVKTLVHPGC